MGGSTSVGRYRSDCDLATYLTSFLGFHTLRLGAYFSAFLTAATFGIPSVRFSGPNEPHRYYSLETARCVILLG